MKEVSWKSFVSCVVRPCAVVVVVVVYLDTKTQAIVSKYVENAQEFTMSVEPYPQGDGSHLHLFIQYKNQRSFKSVLRELEMLKSKFVVPKPQDEVRDWGRVQF